jgi:uncharacterized RDD family membrane protein YckC
MAKPRFRDVKKGKIVNNQKSKTKQNNKSILPFATNFQKTKAALTDSFMLLMPIMYIVFYLVMNGREDFAQHRLMGWVYILIPFIIIQSLFMYYGDGQTPGYKNYNLKVVDINTHKKPSLFSILFRNISMLLSIATIFGWLMMFFRKDKRGLHDILSNTAVISIEDR